jgi:hypothetical protein
MQLIVAVVDNNAMMGMLVLGVVVNAIQMATAIVNCIVVIINVLL